jgi:hypothetical protein
MGHDESSVVRNLALMKYCSELFCRYGQVHSPSTQTGAEPSTQQKVGSPVHESSLSARTLTGLIDRLSNPIAKNPATRIKLDIWDVLIRMALQMHTMYVRKETRGTLLPGPLKNVSLIHAQIVRHGHATNRATPPAAA